LRLLPIGSDDLRLGLGPGELVRDIAAKAAVDRAHARVAEVVERAVGHALGEVLDVVRVRWLLGLCWELGGVVQVFLAQ